MVDPSVEYGDIESKYDHGAVKGGNQMITETKKTCADCGITKTPLWRGGPAGPKSLCNACGIRSRKKRRALLGGGGGGGSEDKRPGKANKNKNKNHDDSSSDGGKVGESLTQRLMRNLGREVLIERSNSQFGEDDEQAALLLMALSCDPLFVFA